MPRERAEDLAAGHLRRAAAVRAFEDEATVAREALLELSGQGLDLEWIDLELEAAVLAAERPTHGVTDRSFHPAAVRREQRRLAAAATRIPSAEEARGARPGPDPGRRAGPSA